jgi:hypothetical protein
VGVPWISAAFAAIGPAKIPMVANKSNLLNI